MPAAILFGVLFTVAVSSALGTRLLGSASSDPGLRFVCGAALLSAVVFTLCALGWAYPAAFLSAGAVALVGPWGKQLPRLPKLSAALLPFALYFVLYFFNSMAPEISFDGSRYHLGLVSRYLRDHGFHPITDNLYAALSQGVEMLYLFAYAFGKHSAASMTHFAFLLALTWLVFSYARRGGFPLAGGCAALLVFASPLVGVDGTSAYNDVAVAAIAFALFYVLQVWDAERSFRLLVAAGLLAGFAFAAKYTVWPAVPYAIAYVAWKSRRFRDVALVSVCAAALILPWMAKNWLFLRNPVAPFYNHVFANPYFMPSFERDYRHHMAWYDLTSRAGIPMQVTTYGSLSGLLGPVFLLSPLALLSLRRSEGRRLLAAAAVFAATYFSNIGARFLIPALPFVALAMMLALSALPRVAIAIALVHALISWPSIVRRYCHPDAWHLVKVPYREALRIKPEDGFLESNLPLYGATRMVERLTPPDATVFTFTPIPEAYTSRHIQVAQQSEEGIVNRTILFTGFVPEDAPTWELRFAFPRQPLQALRVVQTNTGTDSWNMHELRIFDEGRELPRRAQWTATARPNPWGIENVLDNRLMTFWLCGDTLRPGQFVQLDFDRDQMADSVLILSAPNQWGLRIRLDGISPSGTWMALASEPRVTDVPAPGGLRRAAAEELKRRGVGYILTFDGEFGAGDLARNAAQWNIRPVGEYKGARLYQLP